MTATYELTDVRHCYGDRCVVDIPTLEVRDGEILGLVGPSGAGKSTLLRLLDFLETPTQGRITYAGTEIHLRTRHGHLRHQGEHRPYRVATTNLTRRRPGQQAGAFCMNGHRSIPVCRAGSWRLAATPQLVHTRSHPSCSEQRHLPPAHAGPSTGSCRRQVSGGPCGPARGRNRAG